MKQAIAIGLLLLTLGCGHDRDDTQESHVHGNVIKTFPVATDTRLSIIWTLTGQCMQRRGYAQLVFGPPNVVLVQGLIDCGGEQAVGCTPDTTTVWLTINDGVFDRGTEIIAHEFIHIILHRYGFFGEDHPAFSCVPVVQKELGQYYHVFSAWKDSSPRTAAPGIRPRNGYYRDYTAGMSAT